MKIKLHKAQGIVATDEHRFKVICAGRRFGKSVLSRMIVLKWATETPGLYWIVSPTYKQSKMIHWREILKEIPMEWVARRNEVELSITLTNGSIIELKGAENPDALRGVKLNGLIVDEIASIRNWEWLWSEVLRPTLTDYEAPAIFISTPKGFNHFYQLYELGQIDDAKWLERTQGKEGNTNPYISWRFTSYDNPHIPAKEIDQASAELTPDTFAQEYMADFKTHVGLVYKDFDREVHLVEPFDINPMWELYGAMDFGSKNPTVYVWIAIDGDDNWWIIDEHYESEQVIDYHAGRINANPLTKRVRTAYADPSGKQWIDEFSHRGIYLTPATKGQSTSAPNWTRLGIEKIQERLKVKPGHYVAETNKGDNPRIFIFKHCLNTIREFESYIWKEKREGITDLNEPDMPEKYNDHALDAIRYFAVSYERVESYAEPNQWKPDQWKIGL